ncbi:hypothetical protein CVIRNUC_006702 [Coccomyxa viridis]|uniref:Uncharacterized protein n=1 Tax=Coccomyxa viridis TaxID=1274662 RepID=A0AAV1I8I4_9CHLO|nr:hypothetical protein CVIRNUC_006702 [Coccomyxa viridis]
MAPQKTRIVDGEIIREDDVPTAQRLGSPRQSERATMHVPETPHMSQPSRHAGAGQAAFNFSAAPVAMHREPQEESFFGMPGLKIFGAHFQSKHLVALLAATLFLGWKGFGLGMIVWVAYKLLLRGGAAPAAALQGPQGPAQLPAFLQQYMQQPPAGQREYRSETGPVGRQQAGPGQGQGSRWAGRGQGHKLGTAPSQSQ